MTPKPTPKHLLFIIERGGYAVPLEQFKQTGYTVTLAQSVRKALATLKSLRPDVIVAEFNYGPKYGVQISNLEPLLARVQTAHADAKVIVFAEREFRHHLDKLRTRFAIFDVLTYPVEKESLLESVVRATET